MMKSIQGALFFIIPISTLIGCGGESQDADYQNPDSTKAISLFDFTEEDIEKLDYLAGEEEGWVYLSDEGKELRRMSVYKNENGHYIFDSLWVIYHVDNDMILYDTAVAVGNSISYRIIDDNRIEVDRRHQSATLAETKIFQRASSILSPFERRYGTGIIVFDPHSLGSIDLYPIAQKGSPPFIMYPEKIMPVTPDKNGEIDIDADWDLFNFYPEFDIMHAICIKHYTEEKMYLIRYNDEKNYGIKAENGKYYDWETFLIDIPLSLSTVHEVNPIRESPSEDAKAVSGSEEWGNSIVVVEMKGDWLKVEVIEGPCREGDLMTEGWLHWRTNTMMLINIYYIC